MELQQTRSACAPIAHLRPVSNWKWCRVGQARFECRPTNEDCREALVGQRGEAPLVPPDRLRKFKLDGAVTPLG